MKISISYFMQVTYKEYLKVDAKYKVISKFSFQNDYCMDKALIPGVLIPYPSSPIFLIKYIFPYRYYIYVIFSYNSYNIVGNISTKT